MPLPTPNTPGYGSFRGRTACECLIAWLPVFETELQRRGVLAGELRIYQLTGDADASADVHSRGGAFDITDYLGGEDVLVARQMGADATWARIAGFSTAHIHGVLRGCPHNMPARYQIDAVDDGFNGLGHLGHGARDDGPRPLSGRTWRQGIAWAHQQEDDMPYTPEELTALVRAAVKAELTEAGETVRIKDGSSNKRLAAVLTETRKAVTGK